MKIEFKSVDSEHRKLGYIDQHNFISVNWGETALVLKVNDKKNVYLILVNNHSEEYANAFESNGYFGLLDYFFSVIHLSNFWSEHYSLRNNWDDLKDGLTQHLGEEVVTELKKKLDSMDEYDE